MRSVQTCAWQVYLHQNVWIECLWRRIQWCHHMLALLHFRIGISCRPDPLFGCFSKHESSWYRGKQQVLSIRTYPSKHHGEQWATSNRQYPSRDCSYSPDFFHHLFDRSFSDPVWFPVCLLIVLLASHFGPSYVYRLLSVRRRLDRVKTNLCLYQPIQAAYRDQMANCDWL